MIASLHMLLLLGLSAPGAVRATPLPGDTTTLEFRGFRAGARLEEIGAVVRRLDGTLRCDRAKADRRVTECRGRFLHQESGETIALWISAIDSMAGIITLRSDAPGDRLDRWRDGIVARYGKVGARAQGTQWMMQWVRRGRIQLAWRFLRSQPDSGLARWYRAWTADARGGTRKTMIVALARKLLVTLWRFVSTGETPEGVALRSAT